MLANAISLGHIQGISLPDSSQQLVNGHFAYDSFLALIEDEENIANTLQCLDTFCLAFGSTIQWHKTLCYMQSFLPSPQWLEHYQWKWVQHGEVFRFLGIPFTFQASIVELSNVVLARIEKKLKYQITKPLSLAGKFLIFSKVLAATHVYYSSCSAPSKASYLKLECFLRDFLWVSDVSHHGLHRVTWDFCYLPKESDEFDLLSTQRQGMTLCDKWIIRALSGDEAQKLYEDH